jgi:hypothetical protein
MTTENSINVDEILAAIQKSDLKILHSIPDKSRDFKFSVDRLRREYPEFKFQGYLYLHYIASLTLKDLLEQAGKNGLRGEAFANFIERRFSYEESGAIFYQSIIMKCGSILNSYQWLYEIKTQNGRLYVQTNSDPCDPFITVFTAHFFDQFAIRTGMVNNTFEARSKRKDAIVEYMNSKLAINDDKIMQHDGNIGIGTEKGLCLGVKKGKLILMKTFVSLDMLKGNQPLLAEETSQPLFDQFNKTLEDRLNHKDYEFDKFGTIVNKQDKVGRNDPCTCGSGTKYKKCCGK